jgi:hypothetical protein
MLKPIAEVLKTLYGIIFKSSLLQTFELDIAGNGGAILWPDNDGH